MDTARYAAPPGLDLFLGWNPSIMSRLRRFGKPVTQIQRYVFLGDVSHSMMVMGKSLLASGGMDHARSLRPETASDR